MEWEFPHMRREEPPNACPRCGGPRTVRVLWNCVSLTGQDARGVAAGSAIVANPQVARSCASWQSLMQSRAGNLPEWVCLTCSPGWTRVHQLAMQDYQWQLEKEHA